MNITAILNAKGATSETILQIMSMTVFESSGDLSQAGMEAELGSRLGEIAVAKAKDIVGSNPDVVDEIAHLWIGSLADDGEAKEMLQGAIADADTQMPMLELGALTLVVLYGLYLLTADKPTETTTTIKHNADGSYEKVKVVKYADFSAPLRALLGLFSGKNKADKE